MTLFNTILNKYRIPAIYMFLSVITFLSYMEVSNYGFVDYDDPDYVSENHYVMKGLSFENIKWAFTASHVGTWQPVTWLSLMLGCQIHGLDPGWHHLTNLFFHIANTLLLFWFIRRITGSSWRSAFIATIFAIHPIHVESVAWITERKDVLSAFFFILTLIFYVRYTEKPAIKRYWPVAVCLVLGLMSKPILVVLPPVLLLLDFWPLGRMNIGQINQKNIRLPEIKISRLFLEKIPLFILSALSGVVTYIVQKDVGAVSTLSEIPFNSRLLNAIVSYSKYILKMVWPVNLAVEYPHPIQVPVIHATIAFIFLSGISILAIVSYKKRPYFIVGWFWYLGTLIPVIGLVQIGTFAMADRFAYIPFIGLYILITWGFVDFFENRPQKKSFLITTATIIIVTLFTFCRVQVSYWENTISLFKHAIEVTDNNYKAHSSMGTALTESGKFDKAMEHYNKALNIRPDHQIHFNIGSALTIMGKTNDAVYHYNQALKKNPIFYKAHNNLGIELCKLGDLQEASKHFSEAIKIKPDFPDPFYNMGIVMTELGQVDEAIRSYQQAIHINADYAEAHNNIGLIFGKMGNIDMAIHHLSEVVRIKPGDPIAKRNLNFALSKR